MNKSVFFLVTLIVIAFCSSSKIISYDGIIDKLVELNDAAGKDKNDIGILISQVSSACKENFEKFDAFMDKINRGSTAGTQLLQNFVKKLEGDILSLQTATNRAQSENAQLTANRNANAASLKRTQEGLDDLHKQIAREVESFRVNGAEAEHKLVIIRSLEDIITDELLGTQRGRSSFVQLQTFNDKLHELKVLLENSNDTQYAPLVATLLSLAEGRGFSDQKILGQIQTALAKLRNNLTAFRHRQDTDGKRNIQNLKAQATEKENQIRSLAQMIAQANSNLADNENLMRQNAADVEALRSEVKRKNEELTFWNRIASYEHEVQTKAHAFRDAMNNKLKSAATELVGGK